MKITGVSPSSLNTWEDCQHKFFISNVIGLREPSNQKADKGTIVHKILEILALANKTGKRIIDDENIGEVKLGDIFGDKVILKDEKIEAINQFRQSNFLSHVPLQSGHARYGIKAVNALIEHVFHVFSQQMSHHTWTKADLIDCGHWTWTVLDSGTFDPRSMDVASSEQRFNFALEEGVNLRGIIDLVRNIDSTTIEIIDWKTGKRRDYNKNKVKTYECLLTDLQLNFYAIAAAHLFPDKNHIITIFYPQDGGPFTFFPEKRTIEFYKDKIKKLYKEITECQQPSLLSSDRSHFKCKRWCWYNAKTVSGENMCVCEFFQREIQKHGLKYVEGTHKGKFKC